MKYFIDMKIGTKFMQDSNQFQKENCGENQCVACKCKVPMIVGCIIFSFAMLALGIFLGKTYFSSADQNSNLPTSVVSVPTAQPTIDPTSNWKTYSNEKYGFEFKYPNVFNEDNSWIYFDKLQRSAGLPMNLILYTDVIKKLDNNGIGFDDNIGTKKEVGDKIIENLSEKKVIGNINVLTIKQDVLKGSQTDAIPETIYRLDLKNFIANIRFDDRNRKELIKINVTPDQILSTFKFTNSTTGLISKDEAIQLVKSMDEVKNYLSTVPNATVEVDHESDDKTLWIVHVYEIKNGHTATFNWFEVNKITKSINKTL